MEIITLIIIGLSLSIDAFTLSLAYGLLSVSKRKIILTSLTVGVFHFIMPIIGYSLGNAIENYIKIDSKLILIIVLSLILIEMIKSINETEKETNLSFINILSFAFLVSLDSLTLGLGLNYITNNIFLASTIFMTLSSTFTYLGFTLGKCITKNIGKYAKILGILIILIVIVYLICK